MAGMDEAWHANTPKQADEPGGLRSVAAALDLLECFATNEQLGVSDIARRLGIAKSTAHRLLSTLRSRGFIEQDPESGRYHLGLHLFELGHLAQIRNPLRIAGRPICLDLNRRTGLTVNLSLVDGADVVFIERMDSSESGRNLNEWGRRLPAHVASSGKAIAAWNPELASARLAAGFPRGPATRSGPPPSGNRCSGASASAGTPPVPMNRSRVRPASQCRSWKAPVRPRPPCPSSGGDTRWSPDCHCWSSCSSAPRGESHTIWSEFVQDDPDCVWACPSPRSGG